MLIVGIDVSKEKLAVCLQAEREILNEEEFGNHEKGFKAIKKAIKKWLKPPRWDEVHICMEATNVYWEEAAEYFYAAGAKVSVVNPMRTKGFAMSQLRRNKTDKVDARDIAAFCVATPDLALWTPPTPEQRKLRALVRHRETLVKTRTQQSNRLQTAREQEVKASLQIVIATLNEQIEAISQQISDLIDQQPRLKEDHDLLCTIKGIGSQTAQRILAEMYDLAQYESARAAAADAGLTPAHHESGTTVRLFVANRNFPKWARLLCVLPSSSRPCPPCNRTRLFGEWPKGSRNGAKHPRLSLVLPCANSCILPSAS